jgi:hypothetical protein
MLRFHFILSGVESPPEPGEVLLVVENEHVAREVASYRRSLRAEKEMEVYNRFEHFKELIFFDNVICFIG